MIMNACVTGVFLFLTANYAVKVAKINERGAIVILLHLLVTAVALLIVLTVWSIEEAKDHITSAITRSSDQIVSSVRDPRH